MCRDTKITVPDSTSRGDYWLEDDDKAIEETDNRGTGPPYELVIPKGEFDVAADDTHRIIALLDSHDYDVDKKYESDYILVYSIQPVPPDE